MDFTIYSIGSSSFLTEVLNGVAMITGTGDIERVAASGFLLFVMWTGVKYILNPQQGVGWGQALAGLIMYLVFFGPTVTAYVEDVYTGRVTVVGNVPIGPVAAGSIMSRIGYGLTRQLEQGYGTASQSSRLTQGGYIDPLKTLVGLRRQAVIDLALKGVDSEIGGNSKHTLFNYMRECTLRKPSFEGRDQSDKIYTGALPDSLFLDNHFYSTEVYTPGGPRTKSCIEAQEDVNRIFSKLENSAIVAKTMTEALRNDLYDESIGRPSTTDSLNDFLQSFGMVGAGNAGALFAAGIMHPLLDAAKASHLRDGLDMAASAAITLSIQQRDAQWAAEGSSFLQSVRPFLAYVEGLSYAITPITAIVVIMGASGIAMAGKYMMLFFWIQLWMPILSITNLYLVQASTDKLKTVVGSTSDFSIGSFYAFDTFSQIAQTWVGVGAAMMAATPFISLFVVSGSIYTMNSLAGRMSAADTFDEGRVSPKAGNAPAAISEAPMTQFDVTGGAASSGAEGAMPSMQAGNIASNAKSVSLTKARQSQQAFSSKLSQMASNQVSAGSVSSLINSAVNSESFRDQSSFKNSQDVLSSLAQSHGLSQQESREFSNQTAAALSKGAMGGTVGVSQGYKSASGTTISADQINRALTSSGWGEDQSISLGSDLANSVQDQLATTYSSQFSQQDSSELSQAAQQTYTDGKTHGEMSQNVNTMGLSSDVKLKSVGQQLAGSDAASASVNGQFAYHSQNNPGLQSAANSMADNLMHQHQVPQENATLAARAAALSNQSNWQPGNQDEYLSSVSTMSNDGVFSTIFGFSPPGPGATPQQSFQDDSNQNSGLAGEASGINAPTYSSSAGSAIQSHSTAPVAGHDVSGAYQDRKGGMDEVHRVEATDNAVAATEQSASVLAETAVSAHEFSPSVASREVLDGWISSGHNALSGAVSKVTGSEYAGTTSQQSQGEATVTEIINGPGTNAYKAHALQTFAAQDSAGVYMGQGAREMANEFITGSGYGGNVSASANYQHELVSALGSNAGNQAFNNSNALLSHSYRTGDSPPSIVSQTSSNAGRAVDLKSQGGGSTMDTVQRQAPTGSSSQTTIPSTSSGSSDNELVLPPRR